MMTVIPFPKKSAVLVFATVMLSACMTYDPYTGEEKVSKSTTGAVIGAVAGAVIGAATSSKKDRKKGALIGLAAGGAVGGGAGYYMDQQEAKLRHQLMDSGVGVVRTGDEITLLMPGNITFSTAKSDIQESFFEVLHSISLVLKEFDKTAIQITGHTDSTGSFSFNQALSEQRANSVKFAIQNYGVAPGRIHALGQGPRQPIASNDTGAGRQANRRVELKLLPLEAS